MRVFSLLLLCVALAAIPAQSQAVVEHFVGPEGGPGFRDGAASESRFYSPEGVWSDGANVYIADSGNGVIRRIAVATAQVTTIAGSPQQQDAFTRPTDLWGDGTSLYVTDGTVIRRVDLATGHVSLFVDAWNEPPPLTPRGFLPPRPYALTGNATHLYVFYSAPFSFTLLPIGSPAIREISRSTGTARTIPYSAHGSAMPSGLWADNQFVYLAYAGTRAGITLGRINLSTSEFEPLFGFPITGAAIPAPPATPFQPAPALNLWGDNAGHLFFTDSNTVYEVDLATGHVTVVASAAEAATGISIGGMWGIGNSLFATNSKGDTVFRVDVATQRAITIAGAAPTSVAVSPPASSTLLSVRAIWSDGKHVYAADNSGDDSADVIRKIDVNTGQSSIFVSNIRNPMGIWGDGTHLYVTQISDRVITRVSLATGETSVLASGFFFPTAITGDGDALSGRTAVSCRLRTAAFAGSIRPRVPSP
jgi:DNA-binding beta-propeller fold protein YncE